MLNRYENKLIKCQNFRFEKYWLQVTLKHTIILLKVSSMVRTQNTEQAFVNWSWDMITKMRLHQLDNSETVCQFSLSNLREAFRYIPDIDCDPSLEVLISGLREKLPIASYVAVRMTLWGHSVPLIASKGFDQLLLLQTHYKYEQILVSLHNIVPLFLDCQDALVKNVKFMSLVCTLVSADRTYLKMAKNLISPEFPGLILKLFANAIEYHLQNFRRQVERWEMTFSAWN